MCAFRFKLWWMTQRMGSFRKDIPFETQFLIVEGVDGSHFDEGSKNGGSERSAIYIVFLPILEGDFRAVLQGNEDNELEICLESGNASDANLYFYLLYIFFIFRILVVLGCVRFSFARCSFGIY